MRWWRYILLGALAIGCALAAVGRDAIVSLPGWDGPLPSKMYSGYLNAGSSRLFYWFVAVEASELSSSAPLTAWFNGGPGCSSLGGFLTENGPFSTDGTRLHLREFRWSQFTNMLWFENPVGVGFSYSTTNDYNTGDEPTAADNLAALQDFFAKYPEMGKRKLFLAGESYAGIYIPMLAQRILEAQDAKKWNGGVLQGIAMGNGCSGNGIGACSGTCESLKYHVEFLQGLSYIESNLKQRLARACDWSSCGKQPLNGSTLSNDCFTYLEQANDLLNAVNVYNVYETCTLNDGCGNNASARQFTPINAAELLRRESVYRASGAAARDSMELRSLGLGPGGDMALDDDTPPAWASTASAYSSGPQGCIDSTTATQYLMNPAVRKAIHAQLPESACWSFCSHIAGDRWNYDRTMQDEPSTVYPSLFGRINVLVYNGDVDDCVPYTDNYGWVSNLDFPIKKSWHPWFYHSYSVADPEYSSQLGGYMVEYVPKKTSTKPSNLGSRAATFHFATVRGSGHMVPQDQPNKIFELYSRYISMPTELSLSDSASPSPKPVAAQNNDPSSTGEEVIVGGSSAHRPITAAFIVLSMVASVGLLFGGYYWYIHLYRTRVLEAKSNASTTSGGSGAESGIQPIDNPMVGTRLDRIPHPLNVPVPSAPPLGLGLGQGQGQGQRGRQFTLTVDGAQTSSL